MTYELEFLQHQDTRIHEEDFLYEDSCPPIPDIGEVIFVSGRYWRVTERFYGYYTLRSTEALPDDVIEPGVKISIHVELREEQ